MRKNTESRSYRLSLPTYLLFLPTLPTLINLFKPACHGRRCECLRKPIRKPIKITPHLHRYWLSCNFLYVYKWDRRIEQILSYSVHSRDKVSLQIDIFTPLLGFSGEYSRLHARTIVLVSSFSSRDRYNRDIYDDSYETIDAHGFRYLRYYEKCNSRKFYFFSPMSYVKPNFNVQDSVGYPSIGLWRRRCKFVANAQDQRTRKYTYTHVPFKRALKI